MRRGLRPEYESGPTHSLAPNQTDLDALLSSLNGDYGCNSGIHEIDVLDALIWSFQYVPPLERHGDRCGCNTSKSSGDRDASNRLRSRVMVRGGPRARRDSFLGMLAACSRL